MARAGDDHRAVGVAHAVHGPIVHGHRELAGVRRRRVEERLRGRADPRRARQHVAAGVKHDAAQLVRRELAQVAQDEVRSHGVHGVRDNTRVPLSRIAWLTTVFICILASLLLLLSDYYGYAGILLAVAVSAAINLR